MSASIRPPGVAADAVAADVVDDCDLDGMDGERLLVELAATRCRLGAVQARQLRVLALLEASPPKAALPGTDDKHWVREQVACVLSATPEYAGHRLCEAALVARHPDFVDQLAAGQVSMGHARAFADALAPLDEHVAELVAARVLPAVDGQSCGRFRAALKRAVLTVNPASEQEQRQAGIEDRHVRIEPYGPGVSSLWAVLPEAEAAAIAGAISAASDKVGLDDVRTGDQRRADALVDLVLAGDGARVGAAPGAQPLRPLIQVSVALSTLLGLDEQPADLDGLGPIPAALARRLAEDPSGTWRRLLTDERGQLLDYGRSTYRPPAALAHHITARDRICRFPHCTRRAQTSEIDHRIAWADGGPTNEANLHVLCARHHHLKHDTTWQVVRQADGITRWTDPTGRHHDQPPDHYPPDTTQRRSNPRRRRETPKPELPDDPPF